MTTIPQQAAAELRSVALELFAAHTIDGVWPHGEDQAKAEHDSLLQLADQVERGETCAWRETWSMHGVYDTDCDMVFELTTGTPADNHMAFCCYCGRKIEQVPAR